MVYSETPAAIRVKVACLPCKQGRRKCDLGRPCGGCVIRGIQDQCVDTGVQGTPCALCAKRKVKCDRNRPCSRCVEKGKADECVSETGAGTSDRTATPHFAQSSSFPAVAAFRAEPVQETQNTSIGKREFLPNSVAASLTEAGRDVEDAGSRTNNHAQNFFFNRSTNNRNDNSHNAAQNFHNSLPTNRFDGSYNPAQNFFFNRSTNSRTDGSQNPAQLLFFNRVANNATESSHHPAQNNFFNRAPINLVENSFFKSSSNSSNTSNSDDDADTQAVDDTGNNALVPLGKRSRNVFEPEAPIKFPEWLQRSQFDSHRRLPEWRAETDLPTSLFKLFATYSLSPQYVRNLHFHATPRLRHALVQVFSVADKAGELFAAARAANNNRGPSPSSPTTPQSPQEGVALEEGPGWTGSARCGYYKFSCTVPNTAAGMPDISTCHGNDYWASLAGLHREELFARLLNQDLSGFTSEIRLLCRLLNQFEKLFKWQLGMMSDADYLGEDIIYGRFSRSWGRSLQRSLGNAEGNDSGRGVMTRMRIKRNKHNTSAGDQTSGSVAWHTVVITPEEYDTVAARHPELCEPLASEVLGPMTAAQLTDPDLDHRESLAVLSGSPEGRQLLDRLADLVLHRFNFFTSLFPDRSTPPGGGPGGGSMPLPLASGGAAGVSSWSDSEAGGPGPAAAPLASHGHGGGGGL